MDLCPDPLQHPPSGISPSGISPLPFFHPSLFFHVFLSHSLFIPLPFAKISAPHYASIRDAPPPPIKIRAYWRLVQ